MTGNRTAACLFSTLQNVTFRFLNYPGRCAFSSVQHVPARGSRTRGFSILSLVLLLRQKIGTFDQAKRRIFVYDSVEEPDA